MPQRTERTYAEVDASGPVENLRALRALSGGKKLFAVVKAFAYGHGERVVTALNEVADGYCVATAEEGLRVREYTRLPILVLGYAPTVFARDVAREGLTLTAYDPEQAREWSAAAKAIGKTIPVHVKIDTGMRRLGFGCDDETGLAKLRDCDGLRVTGMFSHLAVRKEEDPAFYREQLDGFVRAKARAVDLFPDARRFHLGGSAAIDAPCADGVRVGYAMYGYRYGLRPALTWKARVVRVFSLQTGESLGYDRAYVAEKEERVALLSVGYGDGYPREGKTRAVLFRGARLPIVGRVCMDYSFILAPDSMRPGDYVTLLGADGTDCLSPDDLGFGYEILTRISPRVPYFSLPGETICG